MNVAVIGGGAAGFFAAICVRENYPQARVTIFERSQKLLAKVKISGGGRCNVTNACNDIDELSRYYPRGGRSLKKAFRIFGTMETKAWFESKGVALMTQEDGRVFPQSQSSQTIIDCFLEQAQKQEVQIQRGRGVHRLEPRADKWQLVFGDDSTQDLLFDKVIVATGGSPKRDGLVWLEALGHSIMDPVPSLFSFNLPGEDILNLAGVSVSRVRLNVQGSRLQSRGPLLVTHWGLSGPAILLLSAFGARELSAREYNFKIQVNWSDETGQEQVSKDLDALRVDHPQKLLINLRPYGLPVRLWRQLLAKSDTDSTLVWGQLGRKSLNRLVNILTNDVYTVKGKTSFKEEFVTCGGVSLSAVDMTSMASRNAQNLYFAGEVLDIDGLTGGFNFQAAWTTAFIAAKLGLNPPAPDLNEQK